MQETQETQVQSLGQEDPLEEGMETRFIILALENSTDRGTWWATVCEVTDLDTDEQLNPKQQPEVDKFCFVF